MSEMTYQAVYMKNETAAKVITNSALITSSDLLGIIKSITLPEPVNLLVDSGSDTIGMEHSFSVLLQ